MASNHVSGSLSTEDREMIFSSVSSIRERLPFLIDLSPQERRELPKMGDRSRAFVAKTLEVSKQNSGFLARAFDLDEFERDVHLYNELYAIHVALAQLTELVDDTLVAVGSDAYTAALEAYAAAKAAKHGDGLDELRVAMGNRFNRKRAAASPEATPAA